MSRLVTTAIIVGVAALIVGCGASQNSAGDTDQVTSTTTTSKSSAPKATVEDFTTVVAEHHADWDEQVATTEADCLDPLGTFACSVGYQTLGLKAETIRLSLSSVHKPSALVYKGVPPDEIADLLSETESAADAASMAANALFEANCPDPMATECITEHMMVSSAVDELSRKLDAWSVY